ncbi:MAG: hypothetical protein MUO23_03220 [Anaerolineales bacterium]|nr:hypothetical protein [Anaerolineales bacterium]
MLELARTRAFILVCPHGLERHRNGGRLITRRRAQAEHTEDVGFLAAVVEDVPALVPMDPWRACAAGIFNGRQMSFRLAGERSGLVSAVAPVAALMADSLEAGRRSRSR